MGSDRIEIYEDALGEIRWRRVAANNEIVSESGEGFDSHDYAVESAMNYAGDDLRIIDLTDLTDQDEE